MDLVLGVARLRLQPGRRNHGHLPLAQASEVVLVRVPGDDVGMVGQPGHRASPLEEVGVVALGGVVADAAQHDRAGLAPVDVGIVPYGDPRLDAARTQSIGQAAVVVVKLWEVGASRQRHDRVAHVAHATAQGGSARAAGM